jgi:predicted AAA+ superfamily ATPase
MPEYTENTSKKYAPFRIIQGKKRKALVINGARQVGKTFIIEAFIREQYESAVRIDFEMSPQFSRVFDGDLSVDSIVSQITLLIPEAFFVPGKTIFFMDEIQMGEGGFHRTYIRYQATF